MEKPLQDEVITIKKTTIKKLGKVFFFIYVLAFSVFAVIGHVSQKKEIDNLTEQINSISSNTTSQTQNDELQISAMAYYQDYELDNNMQIELEEGKDFMIYFHADDCAYCLAANVYINQYITLGYQGYVPIYFATIDKSPDLFENDQFTIESTPTMVYFNASEETYSLYEGADDVLTLLDNLVSEANNEN